MVKCEQCQEDNELCCTFTVMSVSTYTAISLWTQLTREALAVQCGQLASPAPPLSSECLHLFWDNPQCGWVECYFSLLVGPWILLLSFLFLECLELEKGRAVTQLETAARSCVLSAQGSIRRPEQAKALVHLLETHTKSMELGYWDIWG